MCSHILSLLCFDFWSWVTQKTFGMIKWLSWCSLLQICGLHSSFMYGRLWSEIFPHPLQNIWISRQTYNVLKYRILSNCSQCSQITRNISRHWVTSCNNTPAMIQLLQTSQDLQLICHRFLTLKRYCILWLPLSFPTPKLHCLFIKDDKSRYKIDHIYISLFR